MISPAAGPADSSTQLKQWPHAAFNQGSAGHFNNSLEK